MKSFLALAILAVCMVQFMQSVLAADAFSPPLTQWNHPDLQGVWNFSSDVPLQRPEEFGDRQFLTEDEIAIKLLPPLRLGRADNVTTSASGIEAFYNDNIWAETRTPGSNVRTSLIVYPPNGRIPPLASGVEYQPGGAGRIDGQRPVRFAVGGISRDGPEDRGLSERCLVGFNAGPPLTPSVYNNNVQIVQNRDHVVILTEMVHDARIVKLGNRDPLDNRLRLWSGDSLGYWEGNTLVVITQNFSALTQSIDGYGTSANKILTERFTRVAPRTLNYEFSLDDPATFTDKVIAIVPMTKVPAQLYEYACHEGNYGMANMLRAARVRDADEVSEQGADINRR